MDDFKEEFAGFPVISLLDLFSEYDQYILASKFKDMTTFMTLFGLLRMTTLPPGYTNRVQVFNRVIKKVLWDVIAEKRGNAFIDDVGVKATSRDKYLNNEGKPMEVTPRI